MKSPLSSDTVIRQLIGGISLGSTASSFAVCTGGNMIIDVEIKIADDNGITLKHYVKRLDDCTDGTIRLEDITGTDVSFKELLDKYLTHSGRKVRDNLLSPSRTYSEKHRQPVAFKRLENRSKELIHQTLPQVVLKYEAHFQTLEEEDAVSDKCS